MNPVLVPLTQNAVVITLAVVSFALAFIWPAAVGPIQRLRTGWKRLAGFIGIGAALILAAGFAYLAPGLLLRDDLGLILAAPIAVTWAITAAALVIRGLTLCAVQRAISMSFASVAAIGALSGTLAALFAHDPMVSAIVPVGAFLLAVGALTAIALRAQADSPEASAA